MTLQLPELIPFQIKPLALSTVGIVMKRPRCHLVRFITMTAHVVRCFSWTYHSVQHFQISEVGLVTNFKTKIFKFKCKLIGPLLKGSPRASAFSSHCPSVRKISRLDPKRRCSVSKMVSGIDKIAFRQSQFVAICHRYGSSHQHISLYLLLQRKHLTHVINSSSIGRFDAILDVSACSAD